MSFKVNDPVHVSRDNRQLEGVVAYLGPVDFNESNDWVGIRLTGSSVGLGRNDGSVQGKSYFQCAPQCGLFVKQNLVAKRQLTRLEELRLKRELRSTGGAAENAAPAPASTPARKAVGGTTTTATAATPRTPATGRPAATSRASTTPVASTARTPTSTMNSAGISNRTPAANRLEEIRQRRAQLAGRTPTSSSGSLAGLDESSSSTNPGGTTTTVGANNSGSKEQVVISKLQEQVSKAESELKTVKDELMQTKQNLASKDQEVTSLQEKVLAAQMEAKVEQISSAATATSTSSNHEKGLDIGDSQDALNDLQKQLEQVTAEYASYQKESQEQTEALNSKVKEGEIQLQQAQADVAQWQSQLNDLMEQKAQVTAADASHYKERAKLQAEVASLNRKVEQLLVEKQEMENNVEDLTLDKEQLLEEKETLEDQYEELKLDSETAQMEAEELKMELEQAKAQAESALSSGISSDGGLQVEGEGGAQAQDMASNLSIQNARLREALIRLREQSSVQQMELSRQLRTAEKQASEAQSQMEELQTLRNLKQELEEQISDLKDMVEQGSAYEVMVEDLSDRVLGLEEELLTNQQMIRELEEAADITAEMEEVQTEELKALNRDLEDRETIIRNLEEAIKMQRKREEDFQRTVSNYRANAETLKQEKKALLELHEGGEGEKSDLVSASQKALARAAQLVQDAAEMRKREAQAAIDRIDSQVRKHLCQRLESMLPPSVASAEVASIKGELLLSKVVGKASLSLDGIARSFSKTARARAWEWRSEKEEINPPEDSELPEVIVLSDEQQQFAATMIHQSEVAHVAIDVSGDLLWLLSAGQWPDIVGPEASAELGSIMGHSMTDLDATLGAVLNTLKEEGVLSPHQSNIGAFRQTVVSTMQTLRSHIEHDGESLVPMHWKPPALRLFRDASRAKYSSLGCYAAVASVLNYGDSTTRTPEMIQRSKSLIKILRTLLQKLDQASAEASKSCLRLAALDVEDDNIVTNISGVADRWRAASDDLMGNVFSLMSGEDGITSSKLQSCETAADEVLRLVSQFAAVLRTANLNVTEDQRYHPFSPEVADVWEGVTLLAQSIRAKDGDEDDINYLVRTRAIEQSLEQAVEKVPKLALANAKVASLEKSLALRSKEIAVQDTRLSELEKLLARTNAQPSPSIKSAELTSSAEINTLKQENRVLTEAMDVMHRQVEEYESEIRFMKDAKSPTKGRAPRRSYAPDSVRDHSRSGEGLQSMEVHTGAFEAALFRPALQAARRDAAYWRNKATITALLELPPISVPITNRKNSGEEKVSEEEDDGHDAMSPLLQLSSALANYRTQTASFQVVDLTKPARKSRRADLYSSVMKKAAAAQKLDESSATARQWLERHGMASEITSSDHSGPLWGKVKFSGTDPVKRIPTATTPEDLFKIQLQMAR